MRVKLECCYILDVAEVRRESVKLLKVVTAL